ncbi:MAG: hypothetical protein K2K86_02245 [Muribaculaceae bacterium]|nr:hypothetical protein [Muribaculaceae bacterium]
MKITLTQSLIDSLTTLSPETAIQVLNTCRELIQLDNDAIERYELAEDAPAVLHDILCNMKKRVAAARRRRERREAKAAEAARNPQPAAKDSTHVTATNKSVAVYTDALAAMFASPSTMTSEQYLHILTLADRIVKYLNSVPANNRARRQVHNTRVVKVKKRR